MTTKAASRNGRVAPKRKRLRLLGVTVSPRFVIENPDGTLEELPETSARVTAADWPTYATGRFLDDVKELEKQINQ